MGKMKKINDRFYFLAECKSECASINFKWDADNKAFYTDDFVKASKIQEYASDRTTIEYFYSLNNNNKGSYGTQPTENLLNHKGLFPYQARGVQEIKNRLNQYKCALLADEQGLGKTIQMVKLIEEIHLDNQDNKILIICPASLKLNWSRELECWCFDDLPRADIQIITTAKDWINTNARIVIVNYDLLTKEHIKSQILKCKFYMCVCDEAHYLKNMKAARTKAVASIMKDIEYNVALTGTPILNKPVEIYSLLKCLKATSILKPYDNFNSFVFKYCNAFYGTWGLDTSGYGNLDELNFRLRSTIMIRREKKEVLSQLPDKSYQIISLEMDKKSREICESLLNLDVNLLKSKPELGTVGEIAKLRHKLALAKLDDCISHIRDTLEYKPKLVVFAHHRLIIEKISEVLKEFYPVVFDGSTSMTDKNKAVESFQNDPTRRIFIGQIQSAGVGITLTAADTVIFVESSWVPGEIEQAVDRCHRIGQKNNVLAQFLTVSGSIDEVMLRSIVKKKNVVDCVIK